MNVLNPDGAPVGVGVTHVDDATATAMPPADGAGMTVFWRDGQPVGHVLVTPDGEVRTDRPADPAVMPATVTATGPDASVVICTRDRPDELARCLASLPQQSYPPMEIIVVDNASKDGRTRAVAEAAGVVYVREDRPGLDIARNAGARRARGQIVAYTDDDVALHPRWLERLVAAFDAPEIGAVTGLVLPAELATPAQFHFEAHWSFGQGYRRRDHRPGDARAGGVYPAWTVGAGASMAFRASVFETVGLFDERLDVGRAGCSGDSEYWYRLLANGHVCRYEPTAIAFHYHRREIEGLASQLFHYMRGHSAALMVQAERTGIGANRRQALWVTPRWYAGRVARKLTGRGGGPGDRFLWQEVRGYASGLIFYAKHRRGLRP